MDTSVLRRSWPIARDLTTITLKFVVLAWAIVLAILAVGLSIYAAYAQPEMSVVNFATSAPRYWIGGWAIAVTVVMMRSYVAVGYTRSEYYVGLAIAGLVVSVAAAAAMTATAGIETAVYSALGWDNSISGGTAHMYSTNDQFGLVFLETAVIYAGHMAAGVLIGAIFKRVHQVAVAICLAVAAYVFAVVAETTVNSGWPGVVLGLTLGVEPSALTGAVGGTLTIAATLILGWWVIRRAPVKAKRT